MPALRILLGGANTYRWQSYCERLRADACDVRLVVSGIECVAELRRFRPNVLVLDPNILWGGGDGVLAVRDEDPSLGNTLVMILTAGCDSALLYRMSSYAIDDLVWQPFSATALKARLIQLLRHQEESIAVTG